MVYLGKTLKINFLPESINFRENLENRVVRLLQWFSTCHMADEELPGGSEPFPKDEGLKISRLRRENMKRVNMKRRWMQAGLLAAAVGIISGCSGGDGQSKTESQELGIAKGRYVEEDCTLPEEAGVIMAIGGTVGENVRMVADSGIYDSADGGKTWQKCSAISLEDAAEGDDGLSCAAVSRKGDIAVAYRDGQGAGIKVLTDKGERGPVEISDQMVISVKFFGDEDVAALDTKENLMLVDTLEGTSANILAGNDKKITAVECIGEQILVQNVGGAQLYDSKGNSQPTDKVLINLVKEKKQQPGIAGAKNSLIAAQLDGKGFFYCSQEGLYNYRIGGTTVEQLIDGSMTSIGSPALNLSGIAAKEDGSVLILYIDGNGKPLLKNYVYSESSDTTPGKELTVYSLYDNAVLRQAVTMFNSNNPDTYTHVIIGTDDKSGVTESDAIRTLNTEILAGKGPDVLILDGLPVDTYIENGMLSDMSDILKEIGSTDGLFENVTGIYEKGGSIYAVPTRFLVPVTAGRSEIIENITDLKTMGVQISKIRSDNSNAGSAVGVLDDKLLEKLFNISAGAWTGSDGTLDNTKLREFLKEAKEIQDGQIQNADKGQIEEINDYWDGLDTYLAVLAPLADLKFGNKELAFVELGSVYNLNQLIELQKEQGIIYRPAAGQTRNTFVPRTIAGISARSEKSQEAEMFIRTLLGTGVQSMTSIDEELGFPVNRAALAKNMQAPEEGGSGEEAAGEAAGSKSSADEAAERKSAAGEAAGSKSAGEAESGGEIYTGWPSESEFETFINMEEQLDNASVTDSVVKKLVIETGTAYLREEITLDDAAEKIKSQISIYLAE